MSAISAEDRSNVQFPPPLPINVDPIDVTDGQNAYTYDPRKQSLEEFLNLRFGPEMPTINDEKNPERDLKNYPRIGAPIWPSRTRMFIIPNSWYEFFYEKTGVTGPYVFGAT